MFISSEILGSLPILSEFLLSDCDEIGPKVQRQPQRQRQPQPQCQTRRPILTPYTE